jgi:hypothetical protein
MFAHVIEPGRGYLTSKRKNRGRDYSETLTRSPVSPGYFPMLIYDGSLTETLKPGQVQAYAHAIQNRPEPH